MLEILWTKFRYRIRDVTLLEITNLFMPHKHLIVFDCDGTLIDSGHNIVTAMRKAWLSNGLKPPPTNAIRRIVGLKLGEAIYQLMPPECDIEPAILEESYIKSFAASLNRSDYTEPLYPGIRQCLESLKALGFQLGIATGKSRRGLLRTFEQHSLSFFFQVLIFFHFQCIVECQLLN